MTDAELRTITARKGYGIESSFPKGGAVKSKISGAGTLDDLEPNSGDASVGPKRLQIACAGKVRIGLKFYRCRLADYSRAISEKALVDCLNYAGFIRGDSEKEIWLEDLGQEKVETKQEERTELTIDYPEVDYDNLWEESKRTDGR